MLSCRPFARFFPLAWLLVFALVLSAPTAAFAKVDMVNGRDGAEGDPGDGVGADGGGGGSWEPQGKDASTEFNPVRARAVLFDGIVLIFPANNVSLVFYWDAARAIGGEE